MGNFAQPTFKAKSDLSKKLVTRIARLHFGPRIESPYHAGHIMTDDEFTSPVVLLENGIVTFAGNQHLSLNRVKVGNKVAGYYPDATSSQGVSSFFEVISGVERPLCEQWLINVIEGGAIPRVLEEQYLTFDFNTTAITALDLGASVWNLPRPRMTQGEDWKPVPASLPVGRKVVGRGPLLDVYKAAMEEIQNIYIKTSEVLPDIMSHHLLPLGTMLQSTVTKSIVGWRHWFLSDALTYEGIWLRGQLLKKLNESLAPLFTGCELVLDVLKHMEAEYAQQGEDNDDARDSDADADAS